MLCQDRLRLEFDLRFNYETVDVLSLSCQKGFAI